MNVKMCACSGERFTSIYQSAYCAVSEQEREKEREEELREE